MIIGICGRACCGKDTVAKMAVGLASGRVERIAFADPMKRFAKEVYDFTDLQLYGPSEERNKPDKRYPRPHVLDPMRRICARCSMRARATPRNAGDIWQWETEVCSYLTPREALQVLGTEFGRRCWEDTWLALGLRKAEEAIAGGASYVFITDVRFLNEAEAVKKAGGQIWMVSRPATDAEAATTGVAGHASERDQGSAAMAALQDVEIVNDGTLEELRVKVGSAVQLLL